MDTDSSEINGQETRDSGRLAILIRVGRKPETHIFLSFFSFFFFFFFFFFFGLN